MSKKYITLCPEVYEAYKPFDNLCEFIDGMKDARDGIEHRFGMGKEYDRGFHAQKQKEAIEENR